VRSEPSNDATAARSGLADRFSVFPRGCT